MRTKLQTSVLRIIQSLTEILSLSASAKLIMNFSYVHSNLLVDSSLLDAIQFLLAFYKQSKLFVMVYMFVNCLCARIR